MRERRFVRIVASRLHDLGYSRKSHMITAFKWGRPGGTSDLLNIPKRSRQLIAIVEVKRGGAPDSHAQVIGQLLKYYTQARAITREGVRALEAELNKSGSTRHRALSPTRILKGVGIQTEVAARRVLTRGRPLTIPQIGLHVIVDRSPTAFLDRLIPICRILRTNHQLDVRVWQSQAGRLREIKGRDSRWP